MGAVLFANRYITIYLFGLILMMGIVSVYAMLHYIIDKKRLQDLKMHIFLPIVALCSLFLGKLFYFIFLYNYSTDYIDNFQKWNGFINIHSFTYNKYGVIIGLLIGVWLIYRNNTKVYEVQDIMMLIYTLMMCFISVGFFYSNVGYGTETTLPIGVLLQGLDIEVNNILVHPAQLYYAIGYLIIFVYFFIKYIMRVLSGTIAVKVLLSISLLDFAITFFVQKCDNILYIFCYNQVLAFVMFMIFSLVYFIKFKFK